jgi:hypothetical protein
MLVENLGGVISSCTSKCALSGDTEIDEIELRLILLSNGIRVCLVGCAITITKGTIQNGLKDSSRQDRIQAHWYW